MAVYNLGRVAYVNKGAYNAATVYDKYDVVLYQNGSYAYINDTSAAGNAPTNVTYWEVMLDPTNMNLATTAANDAAQEASEFFYVGEETPTSPNAKIWFDTDDPELVTILADFEQRLAALEALHPE